VNSLKDTHKIICSFLKDRFKDYNVVISRQEFTPLIPNTIYVTFIEKERRFTDILEEGRLEHQSFVQARCDFVSKEANNDAIRLSNLWRSPLSIEFLASKGVYSLYEGKVYNATSVRYNDIWLEQSNVSLFYEYRVILEEQIETACKFNSLTTVKE